MSAASLALAAVLVASLAPELARLRMVRDASPRVKAAVALAGLGGWAVLPAVILGCAGVLVAGLVAMGRLGAAGCFAGLATDQWRMVGVSAAVVSLGPLAWGAVRAFRTMRRSEPDALVRLSGTVYVSSRGVPVWVVPSPVAMAFAGGVVRPVAVVTSATLAPLDAAERRAVLEHEAAHLDLGHPRLLGLAGVVAHAAGFLPPVARSWSLLRRELEAAADDAAAAVVGRPALLSAMARVALANVGPAAGFADPEHLRYRIERLRDRRGSSSAATTAVALLGVAAAGLFAWTTCVLAGGGSLAAAGGLTLGMPGCLLGIGLVATRPLWRRGGASAAPRSRGPERPGPVA